MSSNTPKIYRDLIGWYSSPDYIELPLSFVNQFRASRSNRFLEDRGFDSGTFRGVTDQNGRRTHIIKRLKSKTQTTQAQPAPQELKPTMQEPSRVIEKLESPPPKKSQTKSPPADREKCAGCAKEFKKTTLAKYEGRCNACHRKTTTKNITKKLQLEVWEKRNPNAIRGACYSCGGSIDIHSFECAHIVSIANGGLTNITNLEPTCRLCNRSCGTKDLNEFMKSIKQ